MCNVSEAVDALSSLMHFSHVSEIYIIWTEEETQYAECNSSEMRNRVKLLKLNIMF